MTGTPSEPGAHPPFDAEEWRALGISKQDAMVWWKHRIQSGDALRWRRAGVSEPIDAVRWRIAGVQPDTVREWIYAEIDAREAVGWSELGFNVAEARKHKRAGRNAVQAYGLSHRLASFNSQVQHATRLPPPPPRRGPGPRRFMQALTHVNPQVRHSYMARQWFDDEAIAWAVHGIEAADAVAWKELGLTPVEAERQEAGGATAMQTARAWWQAGIPFEEVADWIGAGLTPEEAAAQRASGVTVERAAVLRSLRKDEGPGPPRG